MNKPLVYDVYLPKLNFRVLLMDEGSCDSLLQKPPHPFSIALPAPNSQTTCMLHLSNSLAASQI